MRKVLGVGAALVLLLLAVAGLAAAGENNNYSVHLDGDTEVPANASLGTGQAIFKLSPDGTSLDYKLIVANLDNPVAAHIHIGPPGVNGPVVVLLFSGPPGTGTANGVIAEGTVTAANLTGPLAGQPFSALVAALNSGNAYVNVHTTQFPAGEIRGTTRLQSID